MRKLGAALSAALALASVSGQAESATTAQTFQLAGQSAGEPFEISIRPDSGEYVDSSTAAITISNGTTVLRLETEASATESGLFYNAFRLRTARAGRHDYVGETAFGIRRRVLAFNERTVGLAVLGPSAFKVQYVFSGASTKALAASHFVVSGTFKPFDDGKLVECGSHFFAPRLDMPMDTHTVSCVIGIEIGSVKLVDGNGTVVKQWDHGRYSPEYEWNASRRPSNWISPDDVPSTFDRTSVIGPTISKLSFGEAGVLTCSAKQSSGNQQLDDLACTLLKRRMRVNYLTLDDPNDVEITTNWPAFINASDQSKISR